MALLLVRLFHLLLAAASLPAVEVPPAVPPPDLSSAPIVTIDRAESADSVAAHRPDGTPVTVCLAGISAIDDKEHARWLLAHDFLHDLLSGEKVWMVAAELPATPDSQKRWYLYRWPDRLFVNLEMVRQGFADVSPEVGSPLARPFQYWRDRARSSRKGVWKMDGLHSSLVVVHAPASAAAVPAPARLAASSQPAAVPANKTIVYVSASGRKYHTATCRTLRNKKTPMLLEEARKGYEPCKQCNPPK